MSNELRAAAELIRSQWDARPPGIWPTEMFVAAKQLADAYLAEHPEKNQPGDHMKTNEVVEVKPQFAISQIVQHAAGYGHKLFVIAVHTETCPGGTQVHYACRTIYRGSPSVDVVKFNEVELREFTADELNEQRQRDCIQWMVDSQNSAIDANNFAKAAEWKRAKDLVIELQSNQEKETPIVPVRQKWQWPAWLKVFAVAMDRDGNWWTFEKRPICDESSGQWREGTLWMLLSSELDWTPPPCDDWTKSLRINPNREVKP